jgi:hypothetical protein
MGTESSRSKQIISELMVLDFSKKRVLFPGMKIKLLDRPTFYIDKLQKIKVFGEMS